MPELKPIDTNENVATHTRGTLLEATRTIVERDRSATHGEPEDSFRVISGLWSAYLGRAVASADVAAMMALLKIARIKDNPTYGDNWVDLAGYAACGAEAAGARKGAGE